MVAVSVPFGAKEVLFASAVPEDACCRVFVMVLVMQVGVVA